MPNPFFEAAEEQELKQTIIRLQQQLRKAKAKTDELVDAVIISSKDAVLGSIDSFNVQPPKLLFDQHKKEEVALLHLTDWQGGKRTTSYNSEVMAERVQTILDSSLKIVNLVRTHANVKKCVVLFGGDMVEGLFNFPTQAFEIDSTIFDQYINVSALIVKTVTQLLSFFEEVEVIAEWGNHGRIGSVRATVPRSDNIDRMCYEFSRQLLKGNQHLKWSNSHEDIQRVEIGNYRALLIHGDEIGRNGFASINTITQHANRWRSGAYPWKFQDIYCVDPETEALTPMGWKRYDEIGDLPIATLNPHSDAFEWQYPIINIKHHAGEMIRHHGRSMDHFATPDHDMWVKHKSQINFKKVKAQDVPSGANWKYRSTPTKWDGEWFWNGPFQNADPLDIAEFVGWFVSEGSTSKYQLAIAQSPKANSEKYERIYQLMLRLGLKPSKQANMIRVCSKELAEWFSQNFGSGCLNKNLPTWVKNWPSEHLSKVFESMILGDGHFVKTPNKISFGYTTLSKKLSEDMQEISFKLGYSSTLNVRTCPDRKYPFYTLGIQESPERRMPITKEMIPYDGIVWCPTVPNGLWLMRRNGRTCVTGNCGHYHTHYEQALADGIGAVFGTGSIESDNRYAREQLASSAQPSQRLHFIDPIKGMVTAQYRLWA